MGGALVEGLLVNRVGALALTVALLGVTSLSAAESSGAQQRIAAQPALQDTALGGIATLTLVYDTDDPTLAGVALRLHYDSRKLTLDGVRLLHPHGSMGHQDQPDAGSDYADEYDDGDPATDRRYLAAWSDLGAQWPGDGVELPLPLLELRFRVSGAFDVADLPLTGSTCGGCSLVLQPAKVRAIGSASAPIAPTPSAPTPTTTPTPGPLEPLGPAGNDGLVPLGGIQTRGIPTLSDWGGIVFGALLAACAVALLIRRRA
jgi:hypothetical protein